MKYTARPSAGPRSSSSPSWQSALLFLDGRLSSCTAHECLAVPHLGQGPGARTDRRLLILYDPTAPQTYPADNEKRTPAPDPSCLGSAAGGSSLEGEGCGRWKERQSSPRAVGRPQPTAGRAPG